METMKFTGWVEHIFPEDQYSAQIVVANYSSDSAKDDMIQAFKDRKSSDYPIALKFKAGVKSGASQQLEGIDVGDKVEIQYCISGKSGVSKSSGNYYCINDLNITKKDGVKILKKSERREASRSQEEDVDTSDIPF